MSAVHALGSTVQLAMAASIGVALGVGVRLGLGVAVIVRVGVGLGEGIGVARLSAWIGTSQVCSGCVNRAAKRSRHAGEFITGIGALRRYPDQHRSLRLP